MTAAHRGLLGEFQESPNRICGKHNDTSRFFSKYMDLFLTVSIYSILQNHFSLSISFAFYSSSHVLPAQFSRGSSYLAHIFHGK
jgi:hypothetical protein